MERLTGPLAAALERQREPLNRCFAAATARAPIDAAALLRHLVETVDPIVQRVNTAFAEKTDSVTAALFDVSLELFHARLLGPEARHSWVVEAWQKILPAAAPLLAREPKRLAASVSNAAANLAATPDAKVAWWTSRMTAVAPVCESAGELLEAGKVLAWQAGIARYRDAALAAIAEMSPRLAAATLELPPEQTASPASIAERLKADRWAQVNKLNDDGGAKKRFRIVRRVGAFRGCGGQFLRPPVVTSSAGALIASDGETSYQIVADAYGASFLRVPVVRISPAIDRGIHIRADGQLTWQSLTVTAPELIGVRSACSTVEAVAVTLATSHHVYLLALAPE